MLPVAEAIGLLLTVTDPPNRTIEAWSAAIAAALPPEAHALPLPGLKRIRLHSPDSLIRALWDAVADVLARTPAARFASDEPAFADPEPTLLNSVLYDQFTP